jgi:hypothetical protein
MASVPFEIEEIIEKRRPWPIHISIQGGVL